MGATGNLSVSLQYTEAARLRQRDADAADERTRTGEPALAGTDAARADHDDQYLPDHRRRVLRLHAAVCERHADRGDSR